MVLNSSSATTAADCNGIDGVNIQDVICIINIILSPEPEITLTSLAPITFPADGLSRPIIATGSGFTINTTATINSNAVAVSLIDATHLSFDTTAMMQTTAGDYQVQLGQNGSLSEIHTLTVTAADVIPPNPNTIATPLSTTSVTSFHDGTAFLYTGSPAIQSGVNPVDIEPKRVAVIRGSVLDRQNQPLSGVRISIKDHAEFGYTISRLDGQFDMAVNGGGYLTINYKKDGYLPVQRQIKTPWRDYAIEEAIVMIPLDSQVTTVDLNSATPIQVARGTVQTDVDGSRQATLFFPQGITANMVMPDGSTQSISSLDIRATEYTVGENGPQAMPGPLPPTSGYTYAVELSVDEAIATGASNSFLCR